MDTALNYDHYQFENNPRCMLPTEFFTNGISYQDKIGIQVFTHKFDSGRRIETPVWANSDSILRELLLAFMENRLHLYPQGTHDERREAIRLAALARLPSINGKIDRLQRERMYALKMHSPQARIKELESEIENFDTQVRTSGMAIVAGITHLYYRVGYSSVEVANALGIRPPMVRQIIWRMNKVWQEKFNSDGTLKPVAPRRMRPAVVRPPLRPPTRAERRALKVAQGLCAILSCPARALIGYSTCEEHRIYFRDIARKYYLKKKKAGD